MRIHTFAVIFLLNLLHPEAQPLLKDPAQIPGEVIKGSDPDSCPSQQDIATAKSELSKTIVSTIARISCGGPGWRRVGYLDMTDPSESCPSGLALKTYSPGHRSCGRASNTTGCWSVIYNTNDSPYRKVCGRVRGYQFGTTSAFQGALNGIDRHYVYGVSLTHGHGGLRTHIWTFAAELNDVNNNNNNNHKCVCTTPAAPQPPSFVGNDYFCESGHHVARGDPYVFYPDPLWDGENCVGQCCQPPYFTKTLPVSTSDNIELRICSGTFENHSDTPIDQVELYVQ